MLARFGDIEQRGDLEQSYLFHENSLNSVYNSHVAKCFCLISTKFYKCPHDLLFLPKRHFSNEKIWCSETKLWSKVNFSQHVQGYSETTVPFVHLTDIYCFGRKNLREFEVSSSSHKMFLCSKSPYFDGATLNNFGRIYLAETHAQGTTCFRIRKREAVVV